jgi:hypothetical protein
MARHGMEGSFARTSSGTRFDASPITMRFLEYGVEDHGVRNEARGIHAINVGCNLGTG